MGAGAPGWLRSRERGRGEGKKGGGRGYPGLAGSHGVVDLRPEHRDNDRPSRTLTRKPGPGGTLIQVPVAVVSSSVLARGSLVRPGG